MNAFLDNGSPEMPFMTDMLRVPSALGKRATELDWIVTDVDVIAHPTLPPPIRQDEFAATGEELLTALRTCQHNQFGWGVFSGVPRGTPVNLAAIQRDGPWADGNAELWTPGRRPQLPAAVVEIVCWDSSCVLFISDDDDLVARFLTAFPASIELDEHVSTLTEPPPHA